MIVVDTSVWIDFFRDRHEPHVHELAALLEADDGVALTDVILTELLQGIGSDREARRLEHALSGFDVLRLRHLDDYRRAAALHRRARSAGVTVRKTIDCLIASVCLREGVPLLHHDADFDGLARTTGLEVHRPRR